MKKEEKKKIFPKKIKILNKIIIENHFLVVVMMLCIVETIIVNTIRNVKLNIQTATIEIRVEEKESQNYYYFTINPFLKDTYFL